MIEAFLAAGAVLSGLGVVLSALARFRKTRYVSWLLDRLAIQPLEEVLERRIDHQLGPIAEKVDSIYHEMHPNSGVAMRDVVDRTERGVRDVKHVLRQQGDRLARVEGQVDVLVRQD